LLLVAVLEDATRGEIECEEEGNPTLKDGKGSLDDMRGLRSGY
jgi:hypothetical protein